MIDLREKDKVYICQLVTECFSESLEVWVYGSRINRSNHETSDLDLVLRKWDLTRLDWEQVLNFSEQLRESNIPILVEARDWAVIPANFQQQILKHYEVLCSSIK